MSRIRGFLKNLAALPWASALALIAVITGVRGLADPTSLPLDAVIGHLAYAWAFVYGIGGLGILYGMGTRRTKFEAAGCMLFTGGTWVQAAVTAAFLGRSEFLNLWSVSALIIFGFASLIRSRQIFHGLTRVLVPVKDVP